MVVWGFSDFLNKVIVFQLMIHNVCIGPLSEDKETVGVLIILNDVNVI